MSHIQSHHGGAEGAHNTYLVILKVHGEAIHLWSRDRMAQIGKTQLFRISCHNVETHAEDLASDIQVFVLNDPAAILDKCAFQDQLSQGQPIKTGDLAIFMTGPVPSTRKASYAIDLALGKLNTTNEQPIIDNNTDPSDFERIGRTYLYLDPEFSSQGIQRTPILAHQTHVPIGQIQVEYLIVTNPVAFGQSAPRPDWLFCERNMDAGHRGAGSGRRDDLPEDLLENTIDSFNYAHRHGADMCELDVLITADGIPIVYHDFDVDAVAAQQSSNELGKFRVQVNQFTYKQLRDFRLLALHDGEGCPYTLNVPNQAETNRPFPTLADVLDQVDETCGLNIEIKWPQMLESGKMEAKRFREINDFVDRIISVVEEHARNRRIILESFDADLVIMLRLKQNKFPVVFLSQGMTDHYERYVDTRARSVWNGIYFAQAFDLAGIDLIADYYLTLGKKLVDFIKDHNLVARAWGHMGDTNEILNLLKALDLQCVTYDRIDQMKQLKTT
jgi:glycerophosphocholine phosphodiesterase GPCPD1